MNSRKSILIIYTGGTIGMMKDKETGILSPYDFDLLTSQMPEMILLSNRPLLNSCICLQKAIPEKKQKNFFKNLLGER